MRPPTHQLLYGVNAQKRVAIASATKLMTALIVLEHVHKLSATFVQNDYTSAAVDSQIGLAPGERMSVHDLLLALMLPSADDAAEDLAFNVGHGSVARFVAMMNAEARKLGLRHTHYATPIGLDTPGNYSTAADLVKLADYDLSHSAYFARIVALPRADPVLGQPRPVRDQPQRPGRPVPVDRRRQDRPHAECGLRPGRVGAQRGNGADQCRPRDRLRDIAGRQHAGAARLRGRLPGLDASAQGPAHGPAHRQGSAEPAPLGGSGGGLLAHPPALGPAARGGPGPHQLVGPLPAESVVGTATVTDGRRVLARIPLVLTRRLAAVSGLTRAARFVTRPLTLVVILAAAAGAALLLRNVRRRRRTDRRGRELEAT